MSKTKSKKPRNPTPSERLPSTTNWQEKLSHLNINQISKYRTCEVSFLVEHENSCSVAIKKFHNATRIIPFQEFDSKTRTDISNRVKCLSYEDLLKNVRKRSDPMKTYTKLSDVLYCAASQEALNYIDLNQPIPVELLANLIKLQVIYLLTRDVALVQGEKLLKLELEKELQPKSDVDSAKRSKGKGKKGKDKEKTSSKGSGGKSKKGQPQEKPLDPTDADTKAPRSIESRQRLLKEQDDLPVYDEVEIDPRHLLIVVVGVFNYQVISELSKIGLPVTGILEITRSDRQPTVQENALPLQEAKETALRDFWAHVDDDMASETCPRYLDDTFRMIYPLPPELFAPETVNVPQECLKTFFKIAKGILKSTDVKRQYATYLRHLKVYPVEDTPIPGLVCDFYNQINKIIPPDCANNIFTISHAMVEEICDKLPDVIESSSSETSWGLDSDSKDSSRSLNAGHSVRKQVADIIQRYLAPEDSRFKLHPQKERELQLKSFTLEEGDEIGLAANSYAKLSSGILEITSRKLNHLLPALLWGWYVDVVSDEKVSTNKHHLLQLAKQLELEANELESIVHVMLFSSLGCSQSMNADLEHLSKGLKTLFPGRNVPSCSVEEQEIIQTEAQVTDSHPEEEEENEDAVRLPYVEYRDLPNPYEAKNTAAYRWYELLSTRLMLQELNRAQQEYLCVDHKYCPFDDTLLLRFHDGLDEFGINVRAWNQNLRTPIRLREFCRYILHEDGAWLEEQDAEYFRRYMEECRVAIENYRELKRTLFPDPAPLDPLEFVLPNSIKERMLLEQMKAEEKPEKGGKGKKGKKSKSDNKSSKDKKGGKKDKKGKGKKGEVAAREPQLPPFILPQPPVISPRLADPEESYTFKAYDVHDGRLQIVGSTTTFQSLDGVRVTVDTCRFIGSPQTLSLNFNVAGHSLILHHNRVTAQEPLSFHFHLVDATIIAFGKPSMVDPPEKVIGERICRELKKRSPATRRQRLYFVSRLQDSVLSCFNVPLIARRSLILSEDMMVPFLRQLEKRGIKVKLNVPSLSRSEASSGSSEILPLKCGYDVISRATPELLEEDEKEESRTLEVDRSRGQHKMPVNRAEADQSQFEVSLKEITRKLKECVSPVFHICSSPLHRRHYVKRIKSHSNVPVASVLERIYCKKLPTRGRKIDVVISRLLPVRQTSPLKMSYHYDTEISLPSGLNIQTIPGNKDGLFCFRQRYLDKGPQCKGIAHEISRTFTRDGQILIKSSDGNIHVLSNNGDVVQVEPPYLKVCPSAVTLKERRVDNLTAIHANAGSLTKFQRHLHRRLRRYLVDGPESRHEISRKSCKRWMKTRITNPDQIYFVRTSIEPLRRFSLLTADGRQLKVTRRCISESKRYFTSTVMDYRYQEVFYGREDGTHSVLNHDSHLVTQFPDGTRISTWIEVEPQLLYVMEKAEELKCEGLSKGQQVSSEDFASSPSEEVSTSIASASKEGASVNEPQRPITEPGWVVVNINFKYEHPNYATVVYYGGKSECHLELSNGVVLSASQDGDYLIQFGQTISATLDPKTLLVEASLCTRCRQKSTGCFNVAPLYDNQQDLPESTQLLEVMDSFRKSFRVAYNGVCSRSSNYIPGRRNTVGCPDHHNFEPQKLFILKRDLGGRKLWDLGSLKNRIREAGGNGDATVEFHSQLSQIELETVFRRHCYERFLIPYEQPTLLLSKDKSSTPSPAGVVYKKRQIIHELPDIRKLLPIYSVLGDIFTEKQLGMEEMVMFLNDVAEDRKKELALVELQKMNEVVVVEEPKEPPVSLYEKQLAWKQECEKYLVMIRENSVPTYFGSEYDATAPPRRDETPDQDPSDAGIKSTDVLVLPEESVSDRNLSVASEERPSELTRSAERKESEEELLLQHSDSKIPPYSEYISKMSPPVKPLSLSEVTPWQETDLGRLLLEETRTKLEILIRGRREEDSTKEESARTFKIDFLARKIFQHLETSLQMRDWRLPPENYARIVSKTILDDVKKYKLTTAEMLTLLEVLRSGPGKEWGSSIRWCDKFRSQTSGKAVAGSKRCKINKMWELFERSVNPVEDSPFDVYRHYAGSGGNLKFFPIIKEAAKVGNQLSTSEKGLAAGRKTTSMEEQGSFVSLDMEYSLPSFPSLSEGLTKDYDDDEHRKKETRSKNITKISPSLLVSFSKKSLAQREEEDAQMEEEVEEEEDLEDDDECILVDPHSVAEILKNADKNSSEPRRSSRDITELSKQDVLVDLTKKIQTPNTKRDPRVSSYFNTVLEEVADQLELFETHQVENEEKSEYDKMMLRMLEMLNIKPKEFRCKYNDSGQITDEDVKIAKGDRHEDDPFVVKMEARRIRKEAALRRSVGTQAYTGTDDQQEQTSLSDLRG